MQTSPAFLKDQNRFNHDCKDDLPIHLFKVLIKDLSVKICWLQSPNMISYKESPRRISWWRQTFGLLELLSGIYWTSTALTALPSPLLTSPPPTWGRSENIIFLSCLYRSDCGIWGCNSDGIFPTYQTSYPTPHSPHSSHTSHYEQVSKDCKFKMHEVGFVQRWALHSINRNIYCVKQ